MITSEQTTRLKEMLEQIKNRKPVPAEYKSPEWLEENKEKQDDLQHSN